MGDDRSTAQSGRTGPMTDGSYDVIVVEAHNASGHLVIEVTLLEGEAKGSVVSIGADVAVARDIDPIHLLGETGVLTVTEGRPHLGFDR